MNIYIEKFDEEMKNKFRKAFCNNNTKAIKKLKLYKIHKRKEYKKKLDDWFDNVHCY